ncbi:MAG: DUF4867 family protein [Lachnospiraceae bacterium]|nr:DUF4867 family protein [Lachnospiraceae bacterium]
MQIYQVTDEKFKKYGKVVEGIDFSSLCQALNDQTPLPEGVEYQPSVDVLESLPVAKEIQTKCWGELPVQIGYCNGHNVLLNAVEYHRNSEINVAATDAVLILGMQQDIEDDFTYDTAKMEAFLVPAGTAVEIYGTALHYAPCGPDNKGFKVGVVLPKGTNYPLSKEHANGEDKLITATNKWLIAHPEGGQDPKAFVGLKGKNLNILE